MILFKQMTPDRLPLPNRRAFLQGGATVCALAFFGQRIKGPMVRADLPDVSAADLLQRIFHEEYAEWRMLFNGMPIDEMYDALPPFPDAYLLQDELARMMARHGAGVDTLLTRGLMQNEILGWPDIDDAMWERIIKRAQKIPAEQESVQKMEKKRIMAIGNIVAAIDHTIACLAQSILTVQRDVQTPPFEGSTSG